MLGQPKKMAKKLATFIILVYLRATNYKNDKQEYLWN